MNVRQRVFLMIALVAAFGVALLVFGIMSNRTKTVAPPPPPAVSQVLVAARDISPGVALTADMVKWQSWPRDTVPEGFITGNGNTATVAGIVVGSVTRAPILKGEPLTVDKVIKSDASGFMAATLTPGMRAVALPISVATAAGGFVLPENHVDVLLTRIRGATPVAEILLSDIRVLAIDQIASENREKADDDKTSSAFRSIQTVTLELTPEQTKELAQAKALGTLSLALRPLGTHAGNSVYDTSGPIVIIRGDAEWRGK